jgi:membrane-associated protease RseP (regulator of RpoE activity)
MEEEENKLKKYSIHIGLFILTLFTTTLGGMEWMGLQDLSWWETFFRGMEYSVPFIAILAIHEFGHYITAIRYGAKVSLPYFIPLYIPFIAPIGTLGAFIRILSPHKSRKEVFDIGIAGPLAGFAAAILLLFYGFTHLPEPEYIYKIHPGYEQFGLDYPKHVYNYEFAKEQDHELFNLRKEAFQQQQDKDSIAFVEEQRSKGNNKPVIFNKKKFNEGKPFVADSIYGTIAVGKNLIFLFFENYVVDDPVLIPNKYEMYHYPFLFAGYLALFFTALNLIPIGQLDGGHITYGLFGRKYHKIISISIYIGMIYFSGLGILRNNIFANVFNSLPDLLVFAPLYIYLLFTVFSRLSDNQITNLMTAVCVFAAQFFTELLLPQFKGISLLYMVFVIIVGRFVGIEHPEAYEDNPLSLPKKILGWLALLIFVLCFTPQLLESVLMVKS